MRRFTPFYQFDLYNIDPYYSIFIKNNTLCVFAIRLCTP